MYVLFCSLPEDGVKNQVRPLDRGDGAGDV